MTGPRTTTMDAAAYRRIKTDLAIQAFAEVEQLTTRLARKQAALAKLLNGLIDLDRYFAETEPIREMQEAKRAEIEQGAV